MLDLTFLALASFFSFAANQRVSSGKPSVNGLCRNCNLNQVKFLHLTFFLTTLFRSLKLPSSQTRTVRVLSWTSTQLILNEPTGCAPPVRTLLPTKWEVKMPSWLQLSLSSDWSEADSRGVAEEGRLLLNKCFGACCPASLWSGSRQSWQQSSF